MSRINDTRMRLDNVERRNCATFSVGTVLISQQATSVAAVCLGWRREAFVYGICIIYS